MKKREMTQVEFIYAETIEVYGLWMEITRQKNTTDGKWYGISLHGDGHVMSDNVEWIFNWLYPMLAKDKKKALKKLGVDYSKKTAKALRLLIKEALKLGWYHAEK